MNPDSVKKSTSTTQTKEIGKVITDMMRNVQDLRKPFERRWFDNQFFDDGFHYRFISRGTGKMVDVSQNGNIYNPFRAIPKSSKQIRSIINTLLQNQYMPIIYPKRVIPENYQDPKEFEQAKQVAKMVAKKQGLWIQYMWQEQEMKQVIAQLFLIAAKQGCAWIKLWPDKDKEQIQNQIVDNFDMYVLGNYSSKKDLPFMIEEHPEQITKIWANDKFDEDQKVKIFPDNKYSDSQVKEAYMRSKYGLNVPSDFTKTVLLREAYIKEYLDDDNMKKIAAQKDGEKILAARKKGSIVIRQIFLAGTVWLSDKYLHFNDFPYIPLQLEPGPFYQTPLIERFIQTNKSIDTIVSRVERYTNTMVAGAWQRRKGENHTPTNLAGGIVYEYETAPLQQLEIAPIPNYVFNFINLLDSFIREQGMTLAGTSPKGQKSAQAIEAVKAQEVNQLKMTDDQLKLFINHWAEMMIDLAHDYFVKPQEVTIIDQGEPTWFDIVGGGAFTKMEELGMDTSRFVPISRTLHVEIKTETGLGYTPEAKKAAALQLANFLMALSKDQIIPPQAMQQFVQNLLDSYGFGNTQEFMELVNSAPQQQVPQQMLDQIKLAMAQVMHDVMTAGQGGQPGMKGMPQGPQAGGASPQPAVPPSVTKAPQAPQAPQMTPQRPPTAGQVPIGQAGRVVGA